MDQATLLKTLTETRAAWEALLAQIDEEQMFQPGAAGKWSVKDVIAHVTWGESEIAPVLRTHVLAGSDLWNLSDDERNEIDLTVARAQIDERQGDAARGVRRDGVPSTR